MARAFLIVMDSVGIGGAPDAGDYFNGAVPDTGANTLGHIIEATGIKLPNLSRLGLRSAIELDSGLKLDDTTVEPEGLWGAATEISRGKDTPSGHWELAGVPVPWDWRYFPVQVPAFDADLMARVAHLAGTEGTLGNCHASGTEIIARLGEAHITTGQPICYTSADSVFQIAAHEDHFGLDRLLGLCEALAPLLHEKRVGRVIARPFVGEPGAFTRTPNRRDYSMMPPSPALCDWVSAAGCPVHAVGKIGDIFSMRGIDDVSKGTDAKLMEHLLHLAEHAGPSSLTFANFVEFDSLYGHRRDVAGYAQALEWFDAQVPQLFAHMRRGDLVIFTADHGNDPTWVGTDHTRERVPVLGYGLGARSIGHVGFADVGVSVAAHLGVKAPGPGVSFL